MSTIPLTVNHQGDEYSVEAAKVGGRGDPGNMNWGASGGDPLDVAVEQARELLDHVGEPVVLTGGGGRGMEIAILTDVAVGDYAGGAGYKPKAFLDLVYGRHANNDFSAIGPEFAPWVDSWQISAFEGDDLELMVEWVETYCK